MCDFTKDNAKFLRNIQVGQLVQAPSSGILHPVFRRAVRETLGTVAGAESLPDDWVRNKCRRGRVDVDGCTVEWQLVFFDRDDQFVQSDDEDILSDPTLIGRRMLKFHPVIESHSARLIAH